HALLRGWVDALAVVLDADDELIRLAPCRDLDATLLRGVAQSMPDCVLDERLEQEARHEGVERLRLRMGLDRQAALEANLHDLQIAAGKVQLVTQRHLRLTATFQ